MLHYILQVILFQLLFLLVYDFLLKKETFFSYNRWYLILTPLIALALPLLKSEALGNLVPSESLMMLPEVYLGGKTISSETAAITSTPTSETSVNWWWLLYATGSFISFSLFIRKYRVLKRLFKNEIIAKQKSYRIIRVRNSNIACTFFNTIFLGDALKKEEIQQILSHEIVHVRQKHSADLLFFEIFKIIFWFNPLVYIYQSRISTLHEFIADAGVVKTVEKKTYYQQLLNTAFSTENISFINQFFNHSLIKKRIVMLQKSRSTRISKFKYLILLPLMLAMLTYVSCSQDIDEDTLITEEASGDTEVMEVHVENLKEKGRMKEVLDEFMDSDYQTLKLTDGNSGMEITKNEAQGYPDITMIGDPTQKGERKSDPNDYSGTDVPFAVIEEVPVFPGCEGLTSNEERKTCMSDGITDFVNKNFDTSLGKQLGLKGVNRIYVQFRIQKDGNVELMGARAPHPALQEEAKRVVGNLPKMTPGKQKGKEVGVLYSLPIVLNVSE